MDTASQKPKPLFTTQPHGEHEVRLLEDALKPNDRIYEISDQYEEGAAIRILGSELASLLQWWAGEEERQGKDEGEDA
jgi:hypothetical protein